MGGVKTTLGTAGGPGSPSGPLLSPQVEARYVAIVDDAIDGNYVQGDVIEVIVTTLTSGATISTVARVFYNVSTDTYFTTTEPGGDLWLQHLTPENGRPSEIVGMLIYKLSGLGHYSPGSPSVDDWVGNYEATRARIQFGGLLATDRLRFSEFGTFGGTVSPFLGDGDILDIVGEDALQQLTWNDQSNGAVYVTLYK